MIIDRISFSKTPEKTPSPHQSARICRFSSAFEEEDAMNVICRPRTILLPEPGFDKRSVEHQKEPLTLTAHDLARVSISFVRENDESLPQWRRVCLLRCTCYSASRWKKIRDHHEAEEMRLSRWLYWTKMRNRSGFNDNTHLLGGIPVFAI